jgi:D-hydroxyproline dehydrogenase subunit alpha
LLALSGEEVVVCQCEEVTRRELLGVMPPRYLNASDRGPDGGLASMGEASRRSQDAVKRMTRVGMGHCQGRRCRDHSIMLMARANDILVSDVSPGSYRVPVRPLPVELLAAAEETSEMRDRWPYWLWEVDGIPEKAE